MQHHRVLGLDPAIKNYGYSMLEIREDLAAWRLVDCGLIQHPINEIAENLRESLERYTLEMRRMIQLWQPEAVIIERFQNRSRIGASQTEKVNIMIGLAAFMASLSSAHITAFTAAQWKNRVNAKVDIEDIYKTTRVFMRDYCKSKRMNKDKANALVNQIPHSVDATIMALLIGSQRAGIDPFKFINVTIAGKVVKVLTKGYTL